MLFKTIQNKILLKFQCAYYTRRQVTTYKMATTVPTLKLNNGLQIPILGLGTWKSKPGEVTQAIKDAIDIGYRHFDCAHAYENENEVGEGLSAKFADGSVKREDLWITSKLWNTDHDSAVVEGALKVTLANLGLEYLDLYLMHSPMGFKSGPEKFPLDEKGNIIFSDFDYLDTWKAMEKCVEKGLAKSIGISNFNSVQVERILKNCKVKPVTNQVECHPYLSQKKLGKFCKERGIFLTAYSPLGSPDSPWAKPDDPKLLKEPLLKEIGDKHGKSIAQILLRYQIQEGNIVIPKSVTKSRLQENFKLFDFELSGDEMKRIDSLERNFRYCVDYRRESHKYWPYSIEF